MTDKDDNQFPVVSVGDIGGATIQTVNARDLHAFLGVGKVFAAWITERIAQYDFAEDLDYVVVSETGKNSSGGRPAKEYHISLDMAKELSMVERNEKGKQVRQYFIRMERMAQESSAQPITFDPNDPAQLRGLLSNYAERTQIAEAKVSAMTPKADAFDRLDTAEGNLTLRPASKVLSYQEHKMSKWMELNRWAFRQNGKGPLQPYADKRMAGLLDLKLRHFDDPRTGEPKVDATMVITPKGMARLAKVLPRDGMMS